jgi:prolyl 4-hydroxylase
MVYNEYMKIYRPYENEIVVVEDFISIEEVEIFNKLGKDTPSLWEGSNDGNGLKEWYGNQLRIEPDNLKDSYWYYRDLLDSIQKRSEAIFTEYYGISDFEYLPINSLSRRIGPGLGVHTDEIDPEHPQYNPNEKIITHGFVVYINDDYDGGEIFYPNKNISIKPVARSLVMHPGNKEYEHGVKDVLNTTRYSLSWWTR